MSVPLTLGALALSGVPLGEFTEAIMALTASLGAGTAVGILAFTAAVHLAVLYLSYGPLARFIARNGSGRSGR